MSVEKHRNSGFPGLLRRLFEHPLEPRPTQQARQLNPLSQLLDNIDEGRILANTTAVSALLREQQEREVALRNAWDRAQFVATSIEDSLTIADPIITEGLSVIAKRTWGNGFIITSYGPSWNESGYVSSGDFHNIISPEASNPPPLGYLLGAEFNFRAQNIDKSKSPTYDPYADYYGATLKFRDGKPHLLQFGHGTTLNEKELEMIGQANILNEALSEYYRHGPEVYVFSGES